MHYFTGAGPTDFSLSKTLGGGTVAPYSAAQPGDDLFLWSSAGPTIVQRIVSGADVKSANFSDRVDYFISLSNHDKWDKIYQAEQDAKNKQSK
jgi:hypothetical protein